MNERAESCDSNNKMGFEGWVEGPIWLGGHDLEARQAIHDLLLNSTKLSSGAIGAVFITPDTVDEAVYFALKTQGRLIERGRTWVSCRTGNEGSTDAGRFTEEALLSQMHSAGFAFEGRRTLNASYWICCFASPPCS